MESAPPFTPDDGIDNDDDNVIVDPRAVFRPRRDVDPPSTRDEPRALTCAVVIVSGGGGAKESRDGNATAATTNADATDKMTVTATIEDVKARALCIDVQTH